MWWASRRSWREKEAPALGGGGAGGAGSFKVLQPERHELVSILRPIPRTACCSLRPHLARTVPTIQALVWGNTAAIGPAAVSKAPVCRQGLAMRAAAADRRCRWVWADASSAHLVQRLIRRGRGKRILVVTTKSMLVQSEGVSGPLLHPLVRLDSLGFSAIRRAHSNQPEPVSLNSNKASSR